MDLALCPVCPYCGQPPALMASTTQALCGNDDCPAFIWNPTKTAAANIDQARPLVVDEEEDGRLTIRPELDPCHCGRPARGLVKPDEVGTPGHVCSQCSPEHCALRRFTLDPGR